MTALFTREPNSRQTTLCNSKRQYLAVEFKLFQFEGDSQINCTIEFTDNKLSLSYYLTNLTDIVWPNFQGISRANELWKSTCFELFLGVAGQQDYTEFNISPSGEWNCYQFESYREGMRENTLWKLVDLTSCDSKLSCGFLGDTSNKNSLRIGPAAILQRSSDELQYFAVSHGARPDFHDPQNHVLISNNNL